MPPREPAREGFFARLLDGLIGRAPFGPSARDFSAPLDIGVSFGAEPTAPQTPDAPGVATDEPLTLRRVVVPAELTHLVATPPVFDDEALLAPLVRAVGTMQANAAGDGDLTPTTEFLDALNHVREELLRRDDLLDLAWGIIANAHGGAWPIKTPTEMGWTSAAARWRDLVMPGLGARAACRSRRALAKVRDRFAEHARGE